VFGVVLGLGLIGGCAKFPPPGANANYTAINFSMTTSRQINSAYLYYVAIRSSVPINPSPQMAPQPVFDPSKNPNGFVAGSPTQFVLFNPNNFNTPFQLYQFETQAEAPNPSDPTNPINLAVFHISTIGIITNFQQPNPGTSGNPTGSNNLNFTLYADLIPDITQPAPTKTTPNSQIPTFMQVQFLNLNTTGASSGRTICYIGTNSTPEFLQIDLRTSGQYSNDQGIYAGTAQVNCPDPDLDITDWAITVAPP
jgi:hypothetical protein